jgi:hypothetical protein
MSQLSSPRQLLPLALGTLLVATAACGGPEDATDQASAAADGAQSTASFTGGLQVSATSVAMGSTITITETATNLTATQVGPIIVGIRRLGFDVVSAQKPRTGICRIAGSATCNFLELAPLETQAYTLVLRPTAPGTYTIQGWTTSSYLPGGFSGSATVAVH